MLKSVMIKQNKCIKVVVFKFFFHRHLLLRFRFEKSSSGIKRKRRIHKRNKKQNELNTKKILRILQ